MIRLSKSCIGEAEKAAVMDVLNREFLGMGTETRAFESALTKFFGRPAICVINGTAALQLALQACEVGIGDEVLVQSLTYVASFQAISATGAKPVACDIDPKTLTIDWRDAEKRITSKTKAVMPVHYSGGVGPLDEIYAFAQKYGLRLIEDASHALGTTYKGKCVGAFGDIACFSFDGIKNITSGEGGCVVTDNPNVIRKIQDARLLGVEKDTEKRYTGKRSWNFDVCAQGWRYHMSNIMAAIGLVQLERLNDFSQSRQMLSLRYNEGLKNVSGVKYLDHDYSQVVPHIYPIRVFGLKRRNELQKKLEQLGIQTGHHYQPNHWLSFYKNTAISPLCRTDEIFPELITLPLHPGVADDEVDYIVHNLSKLISTCTD